MILLGNDTPVYISDHEMNKSALAPRANCDSNTQLSSSLWVVECVEFSVLIRELVVIRILVTTRVLAIII